MGELTILPSDELYDALERMGKLDRLAPLMLEAGIEPVKKRIKQGARKHIRTGQMADNIAHSKPKKNKNGDWNCSVTFKGKDKKTGVRNAQKAFITEYGKTGQSPAPFVRPAVIATEKEAIANMQDIYEYECQLDKVKV